ncbi:MAG: hypothetical protein U0K66_07730 [Paludibacteraceae bacterium]|nr:hypothetical protein [Paludibacteraceae bacterium]
MKNNIMSKFLRFYRYFIYRIYHINNNDPDLRVVGILAFVHMAHIFTLSLVISELFSIRLFTIEKPELYIFLLVFGLLHFIIFYKPQKWEEYFKEFENEAKEERLKGSFLVWGYMIVSLIMPFVIGIYLAYR